MQNAKWTMGQRLLGLRGTDDTHKSFLAVRSCGWALFELGSDGPITLSWSRRATLWPALLLLVIVGAAQRCTACSGLYAQEIQVWGEPKALLQHEGRDDQCTRDPVSLSQVWEATCMVPRCRTSDMRGS